MIGRYHNVALQITILLLHDLKIGNSPLRHNEYDVDLFKITFNNYQVVSLNF